jgi:uncharacterized protein (TIGR03435 family)
VTKPLDAANPSIQAIHLRRTAGYPPEAYASPSWLTHGAVLGTASGMTGDREVSLGFGVRPNLVVPAAVQTNMARQPLAVAPAFALAVAIVSISASPMAQTQTFDVASVARNTSGDSRQRSTVQGGMYSMVNLPLQRILGAAFEVGPMLWRVTGAPDWVQTERYDITARLPEGTTARDVPAMLRALLAARFGLVVRRETRDAPAYALVLDRADGRLGPRLKRAAIDCVAERAAGRPLPSAAADGTQPCQTQVDDRILGRGQPLSSLARVLPNFAQRPVIDLTGLDGGFDFDVEISPQTTVLGSDPGGGVFTALREQLGLKLEPIQAPLEFVVVERIERPSAN